MGYDPAIHEAHAPAAPPYDYLGLYRAPEMPRRFELKRLSRSERRAVTLRRQRAVAEARKDLARVLGPKVPIEIRLQLVELYATALTMAAP